MATKRTHRRSSGRSRGVQARANANLTSHIASLGLDTVNAYKAWCREHGLNGALNKSWQERRAERDLLRRDAASAESERAHQSHLDILGFLEQEDYDAWCREHRLGESRNKSEAQRSKEVSLMTRLQSQDALAKRRKQSRHPRETIRQLFAEDDPPGEIRSPWLAKVVDVFEATRSPVEREALERLLMHAADGGDLLSAKPAIASLGDLHGNTFIEGLGALARHRQHWLRDPEEWAPARHRALRQFSSLVRHLLCRYDVPRFMDSAFLSGDGETAEQQQRWFLHIGTGSNIRTADIPLQLTKKMAHLFLEAPASFTVEQAFRFGQVLGMGGGEPLARAVIGSRLGQSYDNEGFWVTVVQFFVNHPMLDPDHVGPIVDYIYNQKYAHREVERPDGNVVQEGPPRPNFAMKGRSVEKLIREVDQWHRELSREERLPQHSWEPSGYVEMETPLGDEPSLKWAVRELLSTKELQKEGRAMHHCVGSYASNCQSGKTSVWSLRVEDTQDRVYQVMTIAVNGKRVTQARGKCNARPSGKAETGKQAGLEKRYVELLRRSRVILRSWMRREGLTLSNF